MARERGAYKEWVAGLSSKPDACSTTCSFGLFRTDRLVAPGAAGRWDHGRIAGIGRRRVHFGIDVSGRAEHAARLRKPVCERLATLSRSLPFQGSPPLRRGGALLHRRAILRPGRRRRRGLLRRSRWCWRRLRRRGTGRGQQYRRDEERMFHRHRNKTAREP